MPHLTEYRGDLDSSIMQIVASPSDLEYIDLLIPMIKDSTRDGRNFHLLQSLSQFSDNQETEIERICGTNHQEFTSSVNQLLGLQDTTVKLTGEILSLNHSIQASTEKLAGQKKVLVESRGVRQNIDETNHALKDCLEVLRLANQVHELLAKKNHYAALRALEELQAIHLREITDFKIAELIQKSVPVTKKMIAEAVLSDLHTWLFRIRETSQFLGEVAFYATNQRRARQKARAEKLPYLDMFKLNTAIELVSDESTEFDVLDNEDVQVDFTPLFECLHIHRALDEHEKFSIEYAATRRQQKDLLMPTSISLQDSEDFSLSELLEGIAGFAIVERATIDKVPGLRSNVDVDELWDSMCQTAITLITQALHDVSNAEMLLKTKNVLSLFIQTMESVGYQVRLLDSFLLTLFEKYAELLKNRFGEDFHEVISTDDYMPMQINNIAEYDKVVSAAWYTPSKSKDDIRFPFILPFSQMYPLCCIDIRNFMNSFYVYQDDHFQQPRVIDETLRSSLDDLLANKVCKTLVERLSSQYLGQIVQILINLEHFEEACQKLESTLTATRLSSSSGGPVSLRATDVFRENKKTAEKRIFELVNSKIDDLIETAEYDWMASNLEKEPSNYMQTLTQYLENIMTTVLLGLPTEIKELIYFDALSHAATMILSLPLSSEVKKINRNGVAALAKDVQYLSDFVDTLGNPILKENLDELQQTVALLQSENSDEYYDIATRNKKYGRVDAMNGPLLLEKITLNVQSPSRTEKFSAFSSKFGYH